MARKGLRRLPPFKDYLFRSICLLALVIVAVGFLLAHNEPAHTSKAHAEAAQAAENHPSPEGFWAKLTDDPTAFFTMVLAGLTLVLAGTGSAQIYFLISADRTTRLAARAATRSANVAARTVRSIEDTAAKQLRAYVGVDSAYLNTTDRNQSILATVVIKNGGQTPAYYERALIGAAAFDFRQPVILTVHETLPAANVPLMPGAITHIRIRDLQNTIGGIPVEHCAFVAAGQITYTDVFGNSQFANVRMIARPGQTLFDFDGFGNDTS